MKLIQDIAKEALDKAFAGTGVNVRLKSATIGGMVGSQKIDFQIEAEPGSVPNTIEAEYFKQDCYVYGLKPEDLGRMVLVNGRQMKLVGMKPKSLKYPFLALDEAGRRFKIPAQIRFADGTVPTPGKLNVVVRDI